MNQRIEKLSLLIKAAHRENRRRTTEFLLPLDITPAQSEVLSIIEAVGPISLGELGEYLIVEGGHPSRLVDRMVQSGFLDRRPAEDDRRRIELTLTPKGRDKVAAIQVARQKVISHAQPIWERHDIEMLEAFLRDFLSGSRWLDIIEKRYELMGRESD